MSTLLSTSERIDDVIVNSVIYYLTDPDATYPCPLGTHPIGADCSPSEEPYTFIPCLGLWGFRSFVIGNLAFLVAYRSSLAGPELPAEDCCSMDLMPGQGTNWKWTPNCYKWVKEGDSFVLSEEYGTRRFLSFDIHPFLDNFDQLARTVFYALANQ